MCGIVYNRIKRLIHYGSPSRQSGGGSLHCSLVASLIISGTLFFLLSAGKLHASDGVYVWESVPLYSEKYRPRLVKEGFQMTHALAYAPSDPSIVYLCTDTSKVWRSTDGGETWDPAGSGMATNGCRSLSVDPDNPQRVLAAGFLGVSEKAGEHRKGKFQALYLTENGGNTWEVVKQANFYRQVSKAPLIAYDSSTSQDNKTRVWYVGIYDEGLFISVDGGYAWKPLAPDLKGICELKEIPGKPGQLLIATESGLFSYDKVKTRKIGGGLPINTCSIDVYPADSNIAVAAAGEEGIYRSTNGGLNFSASNGGLSVFPPNLVSLAFSRNSPFILYAKTSESRRRLPFYSKNAGLTWAQGRYGEFARTHGSQPHFWFSSVFAPHPADPRQCLVVSSGDGKVFKTKDGGATWDLFGTGYTGARVMDMSFNEGSMTVALTDFGLWTSARNDVYFRDLLIPRFQKASSVHHLASAGDTIVATTGTWSDQCIAVRQHKNDHWKLYPEYHGNFSFLAVDRKDPDVIYLDNLVSLDRGRTWRRLSRVVSAISDASANTVYALETIGAKWTSVSVSVDQGVSWHPLTPPVRVERSRINSLVPDPHSAGRLYLATNDGVWVFDGKKKWSRKADKQGLKRDQFGLCYVSALIADSSKPGRLFAGKAAPGRGMSNGIFVSNDYGETWQDVTGNLGGGIYIWSLHLDTAEMTLYAGTDRGLQKLKLTPGINQ